MKEDNIKFYIVDNSIFDRAFKSIRNNNLYPLCYIDTDKYKIVLNISDEGIEKGCIVRSDKYRPSILKVIKSYNFSCKREDYIIEKDDIDIFYPIKTYSSYKIENMFKEVTVSSMSWMASIRNLAEKFLKSTNLEL